MVPGPPGQARVPAPQAGSTPSWPDVPVQVTPGCGHTASLMLPSGFRLPSLL